MVVVARGEYKVTAVCEIAGRTTVKETNREILKKMLADDDRGLHQELDRYLGEAESFDYIEFNQMVDYRHRECTAAMFFQRIGLTVSAASVQVGLIRPGVVDAQWHSRLNESILRARRRRRREVVEGAKTWARRERSKRKTHVQDEAEEQATRTPKAFMKDGDGRSGPGDLMRNDHGRTISWPIFSDSRWMVWGGAGTGEAGLET